MPCQAEVVYAIASALICCSLFFSIFKASKHSEHTILCLLAASFVADKTLEVLRRHSLENKTVAFVTDTCSVMKAAWEFLMKELPMLICFGCQAHVWSLFLKDICSMPAVGMQSQTAPTLSLSMSFGIYFAGAHAFHDVLYLSADQGMHRCCQGGGQILQEQDSSAQPLGQGKETCQGKCSRAAMSEFNVHRSLYKALQSKCGDSGCGAASIC